MQEYQQRLLLLVTKWRYNIINPVEMSELNNWYLSLEDKPLLMADGDTIERIEKFLYLQFEKNRKPIKSDEEPPPFPFPLKKD